MRTEKELCDKRILLQERLKKARRRFRQYDNHEDMELIDSLEVQIELLNWVLSSD